MIARAGEAAVGRERAAEVRSERIQRRACEGSVGIIRNFWGRTLENKAFPAPNLAKNGQNSRRVFKVGISPVEPADS